MSRPGGRNKQKRAKAEKDDTPIEKKAWYHGLMPLSEARVLLREDGDWLVRLSAEEPPVYALAVRWQGVVDELPFVRDKHAWRLDGAPPTVPPCDSLPTLLRHLVVNRVAVGQPRALLLVAKKAGKWQIASDRLVADRKIADGRMGSVWAGRVLVHGKWLPVAIKQYVSDMSDGEKEQLFEATKLMMRFRHRNVVSLLGVVADKPPLCVVMENCTGGSLRDLLRANRGAISLGQKLDLLLGAAAGLQYLSEQHNCVYRSVAARNCLIDETGALKMANVTLCRTGSSATADLLDGPLVKWMAPESLSAAAEGRRAFNSATDVWSFGVLVFEVLAEAEPWYGRSNSEAAAAIVRGERLSTPTDAPPPVAQLMHECWQYDPSRRPKFADIKGQLEQLTVKFPAMSPSSSISATSISPRSQTPLQTATPLPAYGVIEDAATRQPQTPPASTRTAVVAQQPAYGVIEAAASRVAPTYTRTAYDAKQPAYGIIEAAASRQAPVATSSARNTYDARPPAYGIIETAASRQASAPLPSTGTANVVQQPAYGIIEAAASRQAAAAATSARNSYFAKPPATQQAPAPPGNTYDMPNAPTAPRQTPANAYDLLESSKAARSAANNYDLLNSAPMTQQKRPPPPQQRQYYRH